MSGARVLLVDDDPAIIRVVGRTLAANGYDVDTAQTAAQFRRKLASFRPELILLDLVLPDGDGTELCRELRAAGAVTPIIVLSAQGQEARKVAALEEGADDYVTKPFGMEELGARIRVALRRSAGLAREPVLKGGALRLDLATHAATIGDQPVHLTPKEFELCRLLLEHRGRLLTQRFILAKIWGAEYVEDTHVLRTLVHQVRRKLAAHDRGTSLLLVNEPGVGYRWQES